MSAPVQGPSCTLPDTGISNQPPDCWGNINCFPLGTPRPLIYDKLLGRIVPAHCDVNYNITPHNHRWNACDRCYGLDYRIVYWDATREDFENHPEDFPDIAAEMKAGSCCYTQAILHRGWNYYGVLDWLSLRGFASCWNYDSHSDPTCLLRFGVHCCAKTLGLETERYDETMDGYYERFIGNPYVDGRSGPTRYTCENWTTDGVWTDSEGCGSYLYRDDPDDPAFQAACAPICDLTPYACCGCGRLCMETSFANCARVDGGFHRGQPCYEELCDDTKRECDLGHWAMVRRPDNHFPTKRDYNGNRPLMLPGDHAPVAFASPSHRWTEPDGSGLQLGPWCQVHYGAVRVNSEGDFAVTICGNYQEDDLESWDVPWGLANPDENMRAYRGEAQTRPDGDVVWPIAYRPACGSPGTDWSWDD